MTSKALPMILQQVVALPSKPYEWEVCIDNLNEKLDNWMVHIVITHPVSLLFLAF